jgi:hypothetical protein
MQKGRKDRDEGIERAGVRLFTSAVGVPIPDMMQDQVLAVAKADEGVVRSGAEQQDDPEDGNGDG